MLTLRVTSFQRESLGAQGVKSFGAAGGSIGRNPGNDWVLPDPERFISGCHAEISCRDGKYYLRDKSRNGTFVNECPVGAGDERLLSDGDRVQIGEYEISIGVDGMAGRGAGVSGHAEASWSPAGASVPQTTEDWSPAPGLGHDDPGRPSSVDPLEMIRDGSRSPVTGDRGAQPEPDHASTLEAFYQPPPVQSSWPPTPEPAAEAGGIPEDWDKTGYSMPEAAREAPGGSGPYGAPAPSEPQGEPPESASAARSVPQPPPAQAGRQAPPAGDGVSAMMALLEAAGVDQASARSVAASPALVETLGTLLIVAVQGMLDVLKARTEVKSRFRVPVTMMQAVENNPLKFSANASQALQLLLDARNQAYMDPVEAFTEGFRDVKAHQVAMMAGMRAAFDSLIRRFDPDQLAELFERRLKHGALLNMPGKGRYWEMYRDLYEELARDADGNFQELFGDEFARAYEEQMRRLTRAGR